MACPWATPTLSQSPCLLKEPRFPVMAQSGHQSMSALMSAFRGKADNRCSRWRTWARAWRRSSTVSVAARSEVIALAFAYGRRSLQPLAGISDHAEVDVAPGCDAALEKSKLLLDIIGPLQCDDIDPAG